MRSLCGLAGRSGFGVLGTTAGFLLLGGAPAMAHSQEIGTSPAVRVVARAPIAVSVTFDKPVRPNGMVMQVLGPDGTDLGTGRSSIYRKTTLRRDLKLGAPAGSYVVKWVIVADDGHQQSGAFTFFAAHGNTSPLVSSAPSPSSSSSATSSPAAVGAPQETTRAATASATASAAVTSASAPSAVSTSAAVGPFVAPSPTPSSPGLLEADPSLRGAQDQSRSLDDQSSRSLFTYLPLGLGAVLVIAAGLVSLVTRRRAESDDQSSSSPLSR